MPDTTPYTLIPRTIPRAPRPLFLPPRPGTGPPRPWIARLARFALTGGLAGLCQLSLLTALTGRGWPPDLANVTAFLVAAQLNFLLSSIFTWCDRLATRVSGGALRRRWLAFHGAIASMAVVNMVVYSTARHVMPVLIASALGIAAAALGNFVLGDCLVFRPRSLAMSASHHTASIHQHRAHRRRKEVNP